MNVVEITDEVFDEMVSKDAKVLVDCYATWCGPCRMLAPIIEELANENEHIKFYKLNVDDSEEIAKKYGIMSIPTLLYFENGELSKQMIGFKPKEELEHELGIEA